MIYSSKKVMAITICLLMVSMGFIPVTSKESGRSMDMDLSNADASFWGEDEEDHAGSRVAGAGDVNGDGYDDILIGAPGDDDGGADAGQAYLIFGNNSGWAMDTDLSNADASFWGEDAGDRAGVSVAGAGDVNGDGYDDILIGAPYDDDGGVDAGQAYLILGKSSGWAMDTDLSNADASFWGEDAEDHAGGRVAGAGDVNGDGYDDILVGAIADDDGGVDAGQAYLILGKSSGWSTDMSLSNADASFWGEYAHDHAGMSVAGAGDVDGDGYDDIVIGSRYNDDNGDKAGKAYLILGKSSGWAMDTDLSNANASFLGENRYDHAGASVTGAGDVDGDGYDDILVDAPYDDDGGNNAGQVYLILGRSSGWSTDMSLANANASFLGENAVDGAGESVAGAGDVNGDGYDDILIGAPYDYDGGDIAGQVYLILGRSSGWSMDTNLGDADASFWGENAHDHAGMSVAGAGDVNGDGYDDILVNAYGNDDGGNNAGQVYLLFTQSWNKFPTSIDSINAYTDNTFSVEASEVNMDDSIFVELSGIDGDANLKNMILVNVTSDNRSKIVLLLCLNETGINTGIYRGNFTISNRTDGLLRLIDASLGETINISSGRDQSKYVSIKIMPLPHPPVIDSWTPVDDVLEMDENTTINFTVTGHNPYWNIYEFNWYVDNLWNATGNNLSYYADMESAGHHNITVVMTNMFDKSEYNDKHNWLVTVHDVNRPPVINDFYPDNFIYNVIILAEDTITQFGVNASDPDNDTLIYNWSYNGEPSQPGTNVYDLNLSSNFSCTRLNYLQVNITDGRGSNVSMIWKIFVENINVPPVIISVSPEEKEISINETTTLTFSYTADPVDGDNITPRWHLDGKIVSKTQTFDYIPDYDAAGDHTLTITVSDGEFTDSREWSVSVLNVNRRPVAKIDYPGDGESFIEGETITFVGMSSFDPDNDKLNLVYKWFEGRTLLGKGADINITLNPGKHNITLEVSDDEGLTGYAYVVIEVLDMNLSIGLRFNPESDFKEDMMVKITYKVYNNGDVAIGNVAVALIIDGNILKSEFISIFNKGETVVYTYTWFAQLGAHTFNATVTTNIDVFEYNHTIIVVEEPPPPSGNITDGGIGIDNIWTILIIVIPIFIIVITATLMRKRRGNTQKKDETEAKEKDDTQIEEEAEVKEEAEATAEAKMKCPKCGEEVEPSWKRCPVCRTTLTTAVPEAELKEKKEVDDALHKADYTIQKAMDAGKDITKAETMLNLANHFYRTGDYKKSKKYAEKAIEKTELMME